ncbi:Dehydrogenase/reductase SDR family member 7 [Halotydeus destructor]|nr:Dehydrogenase/reductase SDR family member 7 [Halotydeus destructor]
MDASLMLHLAEKVGKPTTSLQGKVIWVVGASSGIGAELAVQLAEVGTKLILSSRRAEQLEQVKAICLKKNGRLSEEDIVVLPVDLSDHGSLRDKFDQAVSKFGKLDVLVNNSAVMQVGFLHESTLATEKKLFDVNVFGVIELTRLAANYWIERNLSVPASLPLHGFVDSMRAELRPKNVTVGIFCPGPTATDLAANGFTGNGEVVTMSSEMRQELRTESVIMMSPKRCGQLFAVFIANKMPFAIACNQPMLMMVKISQYFPALIRFLMSFVMTEARLRKMANMEKQI